MRLEIYAAQVQPKRPAKRRTRKPAPRVPKLAAPAGSVELEERHAAMAEREQSLAASWRRSASG